jgi:chromosomal replication initiation ATPase DnaA
MSKISPYIFAGLPHVEPPTIETIFDAVCQYYKVKPENALKRTRKMNVVRVRQVGAYILQRRGFKHEEIAEYYNQHRTNIIDSIQVVNRYLSANVDNTYQQDIQAIWDKF